MYLHHAGLTSPIPSFGALLLIASFLPACGDDDGVLPRRLEWTADLEGVGDFEDVNGESLVRWTENTDEFTTSIGIENDMPGAVRPWHVHFGTCGSGGAIVGDADAYPPLEVDDEGSASSGIITVGEALDPAIDYHVNVHLSEDELETIIACGDLMNGDGNGNAQPYPDGGDVN